MKIGIITYPIDKSPLGIGRYTFNLVKNLLRISDHEYTLIHFEKSDNELYTRAPELIIPNIPKMPNMIKTSLFLSSFLLKTDFNLIHNPATIGFILPVRFKKVLTIHDTSPLVFPKAHGYRQWMAYKYLLGRLLESTNMVTTVSEFSKNQIVNSLNYPEDKIKVIYPGVDHEKYKPAPRDEGIMEKCGLPEDQKLILYVGAEHSAKNLPSLLKAFYKLKTNLGNAKLIKVGVGGPDSHGGRQRLLQLIKELDLEGDVIFTGYVPEEDLPSIYNAADLFVFPSIYEGFGLPVLEAMACGTPVITSNTSSLPEVVGDAGMMVNPHDVDGLAKAMYHVLIDADLRENMAQRGLERAKMFSWQKTAEQTLQVYESLA